jgi:hypothetical protein
MTFQVTGHDQRLTFIHIPKTGGTSITKWFSMVAHYAPNGYRMTRFCETREHWGINEVREVMPDLGYTFAVVRNPWDYMVSLYTHLTSHWFDGEISFKEFIEQLPELDSPLHPNYNPVSPQSSWIDDSVHILRFESLDTDFEMIRSTIGIDMSLGRYNASIHNPYQTYYDGHLKQQVAKYFEADIDKFKYTYETNVAQS